MRIFLSVLALIALLGTGPAVWANGSENGHERGNGHRKHKQQTTQVAKAKAYARQAQQQGQKQVVNVYGAGGENGGAGQQSTSSTTNTTTISSHGAELAFAPDVSVRSTAPCMIGIGASAGWFGAAGSFSGAVTDKNCQRLEAARIGWASGNPKIMERASAIYWATTEDLIGPKGDVEKVAWIDPRSGEQLTAEVVYDPNDQTYKPREQHPKYVRAAAIAHYEALIKAGQLELPKTIGGSSFVQVGHDGRTQSLPFDANFLDDFIWEEEEMRNDDEDRSPANPADRN